MNEIPRGYKQLSFEVPAELHMELKILASRTGKSMREIMLGCLERVVRNARDKKYRTLS